MKVIVDTNIYLNAYSFRHPEELDYLKTLSNFPGHIVPEQISDEFMRMRNNKIRQLLEELKLKNNLNYFCFDKETIKKCNSQIKKIQDDYDKIINDYSKDEILKIVNKISKNKKTIILNHSEKEYNLAIKRYNLGNPPFSEKQKTVCDEYIWELLINNINDDLLFITNDSVYYENEEFLKNEFLKKTQKKVAFCKSCYDALIQLKLIKTKTQEKSKIKESANDIKEKRLKEIEEQILDILNNLNVQDNGWNSGWSVGLSSLNKPLQPKRYFLPKSILSTDFISYSNEEELENLKKEYIELLKK